MAIDVRLPLSRLTWQLTQHRAQARTRPHSARPVQAQQRGGSRRVDDASDFCAKCERLQRNGRTGARPGECSPYFYGMRKGGIANLKSGKQREDAAALPDAADDGPENEAGTHPSLSRPGEAMTISSRLALAMVVLVVVTSCVVSAFAYYFVAEASPRAVLTAIISAALAGGAIASVFAIAACRRNHQWFAQAAAATSRRDAGERRNRSGPIRR